MIYGLLLVLILFFSATFALIGWRRGFRAAIVIHQSEDYWDKLSSRHKSDPVFRALEWFASKTFLRGL